MTSSDFLVLLSAACIFAITIALVPAFMQIRRTLQKIELLIESLNQNVEPLCKSLTEAASEIQIFSLSLNEKMEKTDAIIYTAQKSADVLLNTSTMIKESVRPFIAQLGGVSAGIMAFSHFLSRSRKTS